MGELKYIDAGGFIAGYLQALKENNITPDSEKLTSLVLNYIEEDSDNDYVLGRIKGMVENEMSSKSDAQTETSEKKKIVLEEVSNFINSNDMRFGGVYYDFEENIAFSQDEIDCVGILECYEDLIPDDIDENEQIDWFWEYISEHSERFTSIDIDYNGYDTMVGFIKTINDDKLYNRLSGAIKGKGAFRRFRCVVDENGLLQKWYDFKNVSEEKAIREWCDARGYECVSWMERKEEDSQ